MSDDLDSLSLGDLHSHLVPGVDDGAATLDDALEGVERMTKVGIQRIVTTPHMEASLTRDPERFEARMARVDAAWAEVSRAVGERFPDVDFRRGHEVMLDIPDADWSDARLRLGGSSFVLVEWPRLQLPPGTVEVLSRMRLAGLRPIVAHPERYMGVDLDIVSEWRRVGAYQQVNYGSLVGRYGAEARILAHRLLRRGWADYMSTDFHGRAHLKLYKREAWQRLQELGGDEQLSLLSGTNPRRVFRDEEPLPVPPLLRERSLWGRFKEILNLEGD